MATERASAQMVRWGNNLAVRFPKKVADKARLAEGDKLVLKVESPGNIAMKAVERLSLDELLARITPENIHKEINWGKPLGNEPWIEEFEGQNQKTPPRPKL
jgi:antitoxin MazE